jgi:hypothetical protein
MTEDDAIDEARTILESLLETARDLVTTLQDADTCETMGDMVSSATSIAEYVEILSVSAPKALDKIKRLKAKVKP